MRSGRSGGPSLGSVGGGGKRARHPDELDSVTAYAKALLAEEKFEGALEYARRSRERKPDFVGSTLWMATAHLGLGQREAARTLFEEIVREHRDDRIQDLDARRAAHGVK